MNKKILAFLTAMLFVCLLAFGVSAKDVYVSFEATGDGTSADKPIGLISQAVASLGDEGGTVYVVGEYPVKANYSFPEISGDITVKGHNGGSLKLSANLYGTINTNDNVITLDLPVDVATEGDRYFIGRYNSVTFGNNFAVTSSGGGKFNFFGGLSTGNAAADANEGVTTLPYDIVVNAGTFGNFGGGNFRGSISAMYGSIAAPITITVNGGTFGVAGDYPTTSNNKNYDAFSVSGMSILADDATLTINGGTFNYPIFIQGRTGTVPASSATYSLQKNNTADFYAMDGDITVNITGGTFNGGAVGSYYTQAAYTQVQRGNYNVNVTGGTFANGTVFDATQVKAYEGSDAKATLTVANNVANVNPVRFDVVNGVAQTYTEPTRVVFIGDSITEGYAPTAADVDRLTESYPAAFLKYAEAAGKEVVLGNYGVSASGFLPSNGRYYGDLVTWDIVRNETDADLVFFAMGTNDAAGTGGTNGALLEFEKQYEYFITEMGKVADKVFITNAIYRYTSNHTADHRASAVMRPTQEKIAKKLAATDSKYVFVDLFGLTLDAAKSKELFKDDNGNVNERLHPARAGLDMMGKALYEAWTENKTAPATDYHLTDIYVSDNGTTFGAGTLASPISNMEYAFDLMKRDADVTLHIVGTATFVNGQGGEEGGNVYFSTAPSKLTVVGEGSNAVIYTPDANTLKIGTDLKLDNVTLKSGTQNVYLICCYNNVEITDTVKTATDIETVENADNTTTTKAGGWHFYAGYNIFAEVDPATTATFDTAESASSDKNCTVTVNGGTYKNFIFGNGRFASNAPFGTYSGTMTATVGANVVAGTDNASYIGINGQNYLTGTINATLNGWGSRGIWEYPLHGSVTKNNPYNVKANTGDINITRGAGVTNNICYSFDFNDDKAFDIVDLLTAIKSMLNKTDLSMHFFGEKVDSLLDVKYVFETILAK